MTQFVNEARWWCNTPGMQWQIWDIKMGWHRAGATSCLTTNAFTLKLVKPCSPIFLVTKADFSDLRGKAESHSPNVPLGQVSMARAKCLISVVDAICGWSQRRGCKASEYQGRSQRRVDSICEGYQIRILRAKSKTRVWCVHVHVGVHDRRIQSERFYKPRAKYKCTRVS